MSSIRKINGSRDSRLSERLVHRNPAGCIHETNPAAHPLAAWVAVIGTNRVGSSCLGARGGRRQGRSHRWNERRADGDLRLQRLIHARRSTLLRQSQISPAIISPPGKRSRRSESLCHVPSAPHASEPEVRDHKTRSLPATASEVRNVTMTNDRARR
jgi:hypothetical protein